MFVWPCPATDPFHPLAIWLCFKNTTIVLAVWARLLLPQAIGNRQREPLKCPCLAAVGIALNASSSAYHNAPKILQSQLTWPFSQTAITPLTPLRPYPIDEDFKQKNLTQPLSFPPSKTTTTTASSGQQQQQMQGRRRANMRHPQKYLSVPKHTLKNPDSEHAKRKREVLRLGEGSEGSEKNKKAKVSDISEAEQLTERILRLAKERAREARAMRMAIQEKRKRRIQMTSSASTKGVASEQEKQEEGNHSDDDYGGGGQQMSCAMPMFVTAERPCPKIVVTSPEGVVRCIWGSGLWG